MEPAQIAVALRDVPTLAGLELLVLHGSRARGEAAAGSDWDLAYLDGRSGRAPVDPAALVVAVAAAVGTDAVDVVDLARASALLRYRTARDGVVLLERRPGAFDRFRLEAVRFWCDAGPVIHAAQAHVLAGLA